MAQGNKRVEKKEVREPGLEPGSSRWQRPIVPLDHSRCVNGPPINLPFKHHNHLQKITITGVNFAAQEMHHF